MDDGSKDCTLRIDARVIRANVSWESLVERHVEDVLCREILHSSPLSELSRQHRVAPVKIRLYLSPTYT
jgi:hypothetical protein